ncbi:unnamed protein product [Lactuca saligna]|uniref:Uncharacterized protein n=1 Tax=Lactuca saligna TaxID=75948 RepID=A0AA35Z9Q8_LACSI|nr:unnamed protein product [Lactuca saligna]
MHRFKLSSGFAPGNTDVTLIYRSTTSKPHTTFDQRSPPTALITPLGLVTSSTDQYLLDSTLTAQSLQLKGFIYVDFIPLMENTVKEYIIVPLLRGFFSSELSTRARG